MTDTVKTNFENMPPDMKAEIARRCDAAETNMNDLIVSILARRFKVPFEPSGRKTAAIGNTDTITLRLPEQLRREIKATAGAKGCSLRDVIIQSLADEFALPFVRAPRARAAA